jgi:lactoylglutathione lyase
MGLHRYHSLEPKQEPSMIGWMPAAATYFSDPDNHLIEYLTMLDHNPRADLGIISWSEWLEKS